MFFFCLCSCIFFGFSSAGSFPKPLSKEEETKWLMQYKNGTEEEKKEAKDKLVLHNLRLVAHIVKKYSSTQKDTEEMISIGTVGLMKAILTYDFEKNIRLASYASRCIENELLMSLRAGKKTQHDVSLYDPIGTDRDGNEIVILDIINSDTPDFADALDLSIQTKRMLEAVNTVLTPRERKVICLRYGLFQQDVKTQQEIAEMMDISRSYVSRIEKKALKKLNAALQESQG